jgi:hypothetical protein
LLDALEVWSCGGFGCETRHHDVDDFDGEISATATNVLKPATLETGLVVGVPHFIKEGEVIKIDTTEGKYMERVRS